MLCFAERMDAFDDTLATLDRAIEGSRRHYGRLHSTDVTIVDMFRKGYGKGCGKYAEYFSAVYAVLGTQGYQTRSWPYLEAFTRPELTGCVAGSIRVVQPFLVDTGRGRVGFMAYAGVGYSGSSQPPSFSILRRGVTSTDSSMPSHFVGLSSPHLGDASTRGGLRFFHCEASLDRLPGIAAQHEGDIAQAMLERARVKRGRVY